MSEQTKINEKIIVAAKDYDKVDGRNAYHSNIKRLTLGATRLKENKAMEIAAQVWKENEAGEMELSVELPIHQVFDLMIFLSRTLLYFKEAYRTPGLYDPASPVIDRVGLQGGALPVEICTENQDIAGDIKDFVQSLNNLGELTGERQRVLGRILEELEMY